MKNLFNKYLALVNKYRQYAAYDKARSKEEDEVEDTLKADIYQDILWDLMSEFKVVLGNQTIEAELPAEHIFYEYVEFFVSKWGELE